MASLTLSSSFIVSRHLSRARPQLHPRAHSSFFSLSGVSRLLKAPSIKPRSATGVKAGLRFSGSYFGGDYDYDYDEDAIVEEEGQGLGMSAADARAAAALLEDREELPCPPGCRRYECFVVLKPNISEEERVATIQKYEEILVAGGAMYVEVFNRGVLPLSFSIQKYNMDGKKETYLEGIYLLYTFFGKPESIVVLERQVRIDFNVIRFYVLKIEKKKKPKEKVTAN